MDEWMEGGWKRRHCVYIASPPNKKQSFKTSSCVEILCVLFLTDLYTDSELEWCLVKSFLYSFIQSCSWVYIVLLGCRSFTPSQKVAYP